jgi:hypothetical protein
LTNPHFSSTRATTGSRSSSWSCGEDRPELRAQGERV